MQTTTKRSLQVTAILLAIMTIAGGLAWYAGNAPQRTAASPESPAAASTVTSPGAGHTRTPPPAGPKTNAALPDPGMLRQRVAGAWLETGKPGRASELSTALDHHLGDTRQLLARLDNASGEPARHIRRQLAAKQLEFLTLREEAERWLADHDMQHSAQTSQIAQRFDEVKSVLSAVIDATAGSRAQAILAARQTLQRLHPPRIGVRGKPQPTVTQGRPTTLTPDDFPDAPPPAYAAPARTSAAMKPSTTAEARPDLFSNGWGNGLLQAMGITSAHAGPIHAPPGEAASCGYTPADVDSSLPEVDITDPDIQALAEELDHSPVKIYAWVKNNIEFQPYFGSLKGALATLKSGSGNATDQASLLIALMRVSGVPARYVLGEAQFQDGDKRYLDWLGVKTAQAAVYRLRVNKVPTSGSNSFLHVWAEVCVPYDNYRGSGSDDSGFRWIPLDPSFKEMTYTDGTTVADIPGFAFDYDDYLSTRTTVMPHEALRDQMEAALGRSLEHGGGYRGTIVQRDIDLLPSTLPYKVAFKEWSGSGRSDTAALPAAHRIQAEFVLKNGAGNLLTAMSPLATPLIMEDDRGVRSSRGKGRPIF